jgi:putative membrane protein
VLFLSVILVVVLFGVLQFLEWTRLTYWFDEDGDLRVDSGVLTRKQRRLQLSRLQSVDVVSPLVARLVGLAAVRVEVAGSHDSKAVLQFLTRTEAQELRNEIVARSAGLAHDAGEAPEFVLANVPPGELFASLVLRGTTFVLLVATAAIVVITIMAAGTVGIVFLFVGGVPIFQVFAEFARYYGFTVAQSEDGVRLRHGLLSTAQQTVPPGRVQAIGFVQPILWRRRGWVRVRLNIAGTSTRNQGSGEESYSENVLLPVAPWPLAIDIVRHVLPGVDLAAVPLHPAPRRAAKRSFIQWQQLAVGWDDQVLVTRRGRFRREWSVVPHARTQSVRVTQGPWERALDLATMHVDSTPGRVRIVAHHQDAGTVRAYAQHQADRAAAARATDTSVRWGRQP